MAAKEVHWDEVYRHSLYVLQHEQSCLRFRLDAAIGRLPQPLVSLLHRQNSFFLITAWNPMSEERPRAENEQANASLKQRLLAEKLPFAEAYGQSLPAAEVFWREDGFVVFGQSLPTALSWGRSVRQRALVWAQGGQIGLLRCEDGHFLPCGAAMVMDAAL